MEELSDGDIVWVKVSNSWWPGEVMGEERLSEDFLSSLRKKPLAVVKFFQEDTYEYVKNPSFIFKYNCPRKGEFLRKGLEQFRAKKKHMETFPEDVMHAERMTGGDPNIVNSTDFLPQKKERYSGLFQEPRSPIMKGKGNQKATSLNNTPTKPLTVRKLSHEVRILPQSPAQVSSKTPSSEGESGNTPSVSSMGTGSTGPAVSPLSSATAQLYHCYKCNYSANRQNLIVLHMKHCWGSAAANSGKSAPASTPPVSRIVEDRKISTPNTPKDEANDLTEDDDPREEESIEVKSVGRPKRSLGPGTKQESKAVDVDTTNQAGVPKRTAGRPPKKTPTAGVRRNRRGQADKPESADVLGEEERKPEEESMETDSHPADEEMVSMKESTRKEPVPSSSSSSSKRGNEDTKKTDGRLKNELLADWSEDENEDDTESSDRLTEDDRKAESVASSDEKTALPKETIAQETIDGGTSCSTKSKPNDGNEKASKTPGAKARGSKSDPEADKKGADVGKNRSANNTASKSSKDSRESEPAAATIAAVVVAPTTVPPVISPCTTIKYRNIPKKQKREYIEVTNEDASSVPSREGSTASSSSAAGSRDDSTLGTSLQSSTVPVSTAERPISAKQLILNRATHSGSSGDETPAAARAEEAPASAKHAGKSKKPTADEQQPPQPPPPASCFDFDDDDEGKQDSSSVQFSSITPSSRRSGSAVERKKSIANERKKSTNDNALASQTEKPAEMSPDGMDKPEESERDKDAQLSQDIDALLCETNVPKLPDDLNEVVAAATTTTNVPSSSSSNTIDCNRTLPPKERGKRIFKTRNRNDANSLSSTGTACDEEASESPADAAETNEEERHEQVVEGDELSDALPGAEGDAKSNESQNSSAEPSNNDAADSQGERMNATSRSTRSKHSKEEEPEQGDQIPSITSSEPALKAPEVSEKKKRKEEEPAPTAAPIVDTADDGGHDSLPPKSTRGRRGKQRKASSVVAAGSDEPLAEKVTVATETTVEQQVDGREARKESKKLLAHNEEKKEEIVEVAAKKKRKSSELHLPDSSEGMTVVGRSQGASSVERKRGKKRREVSSPDPGMIESSECKHDSVSVAAGSSSPLNEVVAKEECDATASALTPPTPAAVVVAAQSSSSSSSSASSAVASSSKSINPRKRHLQTMIQSSEAAASSAQKQEATVVATEASTTSADAGMAQAPEHETPSIPEKKKRDSGPGGAEPSTSGEPPVPAVAAAEAAPTVSEDDKFDIDSMPIVMGGDNGLLVEAEQQTPKTLPHTSTPVPSTIATGKSINGGSGGSSAKAGGVVSKAAKEKRPTLVASVKGGTAVGEQIVITSKGTVITTSSSAVTSKLSSKPSVTVTSAITIGTGGRNACAVSASTTSFVRRHSDNPVADQQPESSSNGQQQPRLVESGSSSSSLKLPTASAAPLTSSSSLSSSASSTAPKKAITKKILLGDTPMSSSSMANSSSNSSSSSSSSTGSKLIDAANDRRCSGDGASSSVSSSSSAGTSLGGGESGGKKNTRVLKVTPQKMKEFSRLGYIEDRGKGKVLTPSGMRKFKQELQQQQQQEESQAKKKVKPSAVSQGTKVPPPPLPPHSTNATGSSTGRKSVSEVASSGNVVVAAAADSSVQELASGQVLSSNDAELAESTVEAGNVMIITKTDHIQAGSSTSSAVETSAAASSVDNVASAVLIESSPSSSATEVILGSTELAAVEASSSNGGVQESPQLIAVPAENFGGPASLFYLCSVRDESLVPVNNELLYLDSSNQLVALPEQQQQQQHSAAPGQATGGATAEDIINQAEVIIPTGGSNGGGSGGSEVVGNALAVGSTVAVAAAAGGNEVDAAASSDGAGQSFLLNTQDGQQIILDQQSLMALAAGGDTPHLLTADGQQILLQETAQEWLAALSASQQAGQQQQHPGGTVSALVTPEGTQIIVAHDQPGLIELQEHPILLPSDVIQVNPNTTIETNAVLTKPPIMSTVEVPTKNGIDTSAVASETDRSKGSSRTVARAGSGSGSPPGSLLGSTNLDESLAAVIGHVPSNPHVPTSLELPITVTNPAIAKTTTTSSRLNPPLFPVTTIATTVPSPSDMLSVGTGATVVLVAADQATVAVAGTIDDHVPKPPTSPVPAPVPPPSSSCPSSLSATTGHLPSHRESPTCEETILSSPPAAQTEPSEDEDADDIQIPSTPESQQNCDRQIEYDYSDNENDSQEDPALEDNAGELLEDGNSNCSEIIPLQPNVVVLENDVEGMLPSMNNAEDDGIDEMDLDSDEDDRRRLVALNNNRRGHLEQQRSRNGTVVVGLGGRGASDNELHSHGGSNNDSGIDTNMHATVYDCQAAGHGDGRTTIAAAAAATGRTIVER